MSAFQPKPPLTSPEDGPPLDALEGVIERITFHNEENGYTVARLLPPNARDVITILGNFTNPVVGESLLCHGIWINHAQWGKQMQVARYEVVRPATAFAIEKYLGSGMVKGVGPVTAKRIVAKFGAESLDIIEQHPRKLLAVPGLGEKTLVKITQAWKDQREVRNIMLFLQSHGVSPAYAVKIYKQYGGQAIEIVERNPYQLASDIWGIGFKSADKIARAIGIVEDDPRRIEAGVVYVLNEAVDTGGNAFLTQTELEDRANEILGVGDVASAMTALAESGRVVAETSTLLGQSETAIYTPSLHKTEIGLAAKLNALIATPLAPPDPAKFETWLTALMDNHEFPLSDEQRGAVRTALTSRFSVLTGGPGVGKTATTNVIVAAFEAQQKDVLLASPTGRAAKRMAEVTGREAKTVHRLLEFNPEGGGFKRDEDLPLECDVLIVDESSMLDMVLTYSLLKAIPRDAQVLFVGDVDQLPSVGPGNVLRDLIDSGAVPVARLTQVFRQAAESLIITNAHAINEGRMPQLPPPSAGRDCAWLNAEEAEEVADKVVAVVARSLPKRGYAPGDIQVLTPMQRGSAGAAHLNTRLQETLNPARPGVDEIQRGPRLFRVGDRVMQVRNNYDKFVYNGDIGAVLAVNHDDEILTVGFPDTAGTTEVIYEFSDLDELTLAFCTSIHKCIAQNERVYTRDRGLIAIKDLQVGDFVYTSDHTPRPVLDVVPTGLKPVVRITTRMGYRIDVSADHPLLVSTGNLPEYKTARELNAGDYVSLSRNPVDAPLQVSLDAYDSRLGRQTLLLPCLLDEDLAWFLGATVGDGLYRDQKDGTVDFTNQDEDVLCKYKDILESYGLRVCTYRPAERNATRLYVVSKAFRDWLLQLGLGYYTAGSKGVPEAIFRSPAAVKLAFLRGLFDTDGSASQGAIRSCRLVTASPVLAEQVQQLLLSLGILAIRARSAANAWCVSVSGTSLSRFAAVVGFTVRYKQVRLAALLNRAAGLGFKTNHDYLPHSDLILQECKDALLACLGKSRGIKGKGLYGNGECHIGYIFRKAVRGRLLTHQNAQQIKEYLTARNVPVPNSLTDAVSLHHCYDCIASIEFLTEEVPMYDIEVQGLHSFVANGFVCHNSQGSEYPAVVLALHTQHYMLLQRNLLYTGLTRARKFACLIGPQRAIAMAVKKQSDIGRHTRLKERLQGLI